jgi:hypothetical protein
MWYAVTVIQVNQVNLFMLIIHDFSISLDALITSEFEMAFKWHNGQCCWLGLDLWSYKTVPTPRECRTNRIFTGHVVAGFLGLALPSWYQALLQIVTYSDPFKFLITLVPPLWGEGGSELQRSASVLHDEWKQTINSHKSIRLGSHSRCVFPTVLCRFHSVLRV